MGLDTYAIQWPPKTEDGEDAPENAFADVGNLCGGIFSGNGNDGSFRGKVYNEYVQEVTGVSLYQEVILPDVIAEMAPKLRERAALGSPYEENWQIDTEAQESLAKFFEVCVENGYALRGWW